LVRIKICGISDVETALAAAEAGADMLGMVFAPSRRRVILPQAREIARAVRCLPEPPILVGVFAGSLPEEVNQAARYCLLDRVQLSGDEDWDYCRHVAYPIHKTIHIQPGTAAERVTDDIKAGYDARLEQTLVFLLDTGNATGSGGTGEVFDWEIAREVCESYPVMIAGGLSPENVVSLLARVQPAGVDVCSGVESNGRKDISKIRAFISAVRQAERKCEQDV
jgi:phosphoribosylanthranilate isomerase